MLWAYYVSVALAGLLGIALVITWGIIILKIGTPQMNRQGTGAHKEPHGQDHTKCRWWRQSRT